MVLLQILLAFSGLSRLFIFDRSVKEIELSGEKCTPYFFHKVEELSYEDSVTSKCNADRNKKYLLRELYLKRDMRQYMKEMCSSRNEIAKCIDTFVLTSGPCLNLSDWRLIDVWERTDSQLLDSVCYDDSIDRAFGSSNYMCLTDGLSEALRICSGDVYSAMRGTKRYSGVQQISCKEFERLDMCLEDILPQYCGTDGSRIIRNGINIIGKNVCLRDETDLIPHRIARSIGASEKMQHIEHKVKNLCITNGHTSQKLEDTLENMKKCVDKKQIFLVPKHEYLANVDNCSKGAITLFKSCLPEKYKFFPDFLFEIVDSLISFLYDDFTIITSELTPCLSDLQSDNSTAEYDRCVAKVTDDIQDELVDSKEKFCENWIPLNECYIKQVKKYCKASKELTRFEDDYMEAIKRPCENKKKPNK